MKHGVIPCTGMQSIKTQVLGNRCSIKHAFWSFFDYGFNAASKTGNLGLNAAFNIEILNHYKNTIYNESVLSLANNIF